MVVEVNGAKRELDAGATVADLITQLGLGKAACAVEVNGELVRKLDHGRAGLAEGDRVEVVTLVGGG